MSLALQADSWLSELNPWCAPVLQSASFPTLYSLQGMSKVNSFSSTGFNFHRGRWQIFKRQIALGKHQFVVDRKGKESIQMEMAKQTFGKQMFSIPCRDSGTQRRLWFSGPEFSLLHLTGILYRLSLVRVLFLDPALYVSSLRHLQGR